MNKPADPPLPDPDIGPLDEHGQEVWSPEEEAAIARLDADPDFWPSIERSRAQYARGESHSTEEVRSHLAEVKRQWRSERGLR